MITVVEDTLGEAWLKCTQSVLEHGVPHYDEDVVILEVLGLSLEVASPSSDDQIVSEKGDRYVIERMLKKFSKGVEMEDRPFTYGQLIYDMNGIDQFDWMVGRLRNKSETKSAAISLLVPGLNQANLPCLCVVDSKIRNGKLNLQFFFRSQNVFGRQYANLVAIARLQEKLAASVGCDIGILKGYIASAHIYEYDLEEARSLVEGRPLNIVDRYYSNGPASVRISS